MFFATSPLYTYNTFTVQGDTVINGITCSRLNRLHYSCNLRFYIEYMYEDSNRVYFWDNASSDFLLLYDFNLNQGDMYEVLKAYEYDIPPYDTIPVYIDSVYFINLGGQMRKVQEVSAQVYQNPPQTQFRIIEGIGSDWQMFFWNSETCDDQFDDELRCYEDSIIGFHNFWGNPNCEQVPTSTVKPFSSQAKLKLYPQPASNTIRWEEPNPNGFEYAVTIWNQEGKRVKTKVTTQNEISVNELANGMYFLEVLSPEGRRFGKFIRQR